VYLQRILFRFCMAWSRGFVICLLSLFCKPPKVPMLDGHCVLRFPAPVLQSTKSYAHLKERASRLDATLQCNDATRTVNLFRLVHVLSGDAFRPSVRSYR
jgi:hypothetical protein